MAGEPDADLPRAIAFVEAALPGWGWLLRSDTDRGYFANLLSPDFQQVTVVSGDRNKDESVGRTCGAYRASPSAALRAAVAKLQGMSH